MLEVSAAMDRVQVSRPDLGIFRMRWQDNGAYAALPVRTSSFRTDCGASPPRGKCSSQGQARAGISPIPGALRAHGSYMLPSSPYVRINTSRPQLAALLSSESLSSGLLPPCIPAKMLTPCKSLGVVGANSYRLVFWDEREHLVL